MALCLFLSACQTRDNPETIHAIGNSLSKANEVIAANNETVYEDLAEKLKDLRTQAKASLWMPRALTVKTLSEEVYKYINGLKQQLGALKEDDKAGVQKLFRKEGDSLYNKLVRYNKDVLLALNPEAFGDWPMVAVQLKKDIESFQKDIAARSGILIDSVSGQSPNNQHWAKVYLHPSSRPLAMAILNKIHNDVLVTENSLAYHINRQTSSLVHHYEVFRAVAVLSSSYVKAGQPIEVTVGIGAFSAASRPTITINGSVMKLEDEVAVYNLNTNQKPGKYMVPVKIQYAKPDGSDAIVTKNLEYIIAE